MLQYISWSKSTLCRLSWDELPATLPELAVIAQGLIQAAMVIRRAQFRRCMYCKKSTPPEWQHGADVCQACAERHLGVAY